MMDLQAKSDHESDQYGASSSQPGEASPLQSGQRDTQQSKKNAIRKRTKTGCRTCRKRRIKCDEGKPTCTNCIKSKRDCEGYNQRLTFKEPLSSYHHHAAFFGHPIYPPHHADPMTAAQLGAQQQQARNSTSRGSPLTIIAPRPPDMYHFEEVYPRHPSVSGGMPHHHGMSPTQQLSPANGMSNMPFNHAQMQAPISPLADLGMGDLGPDTTFFNTAPPPPVVRPEVGNGLFQQSQYSPALNNRPQPSPMFTGPGYAPRPPTGPLGDVRFTGAYRDQVDYWSSDDEASMGESDDESGHTHDQQIAANLRSHELGIRVAQRLQQHQQQPYDDYYGGTQVRSFHGFVGAPNHELETYMPSSTSSPLNDTQTAAVFWHFVNTTGPSMSLYERHPFDPQPMFEGQPVPKTRQHIWTYTFPIVSFNHPALMQAMLALSSLQMAKLQGIPATASMKHYHLSLRRIAKNYQSATRRTQPATLAATLLLGFYEVWNSDHDKWCKHMWGARAIIKEIPMRDMTKAIMSLKRNRRQRAREARDQRQRHRQQHGGGYADPFDEEDDVVEADLTDVNAGLVSQIAGQTVTYDDFGHVLHEDGHHRSSKRYTERDIETYEHLSDLYWWYCKMDVYQSILGGTKLFMEYDLWTQCAPRGPFGRIDAIFGTYDHLMLLLGRLCSFASHDLARKRKAVNRGGPGARGPGSTGTGSGQSPPMFAGLMPASGKVTRPTGFSPPREETPQSEASEEPDFEESTAAALREWESIRQAFEIFRANLGPDFDPCGPDEVPPQPTPFGPAHSYRTLSMAGMWMNYYMGLVVLHRSHPSMPPVAMVAAGMAAQQTNVWAMEIGRIACGLTTEDCSNVTSISTLMGAAFIESCFCLFVAGVQYQNTAQRHWTIKRLHDIARLTGWQSARQIADGCESAWTKAAQFGRGPPYQRSAEVVHSLPAVWGTNIRRIDRKFAEVDSSTPETASQITGGREEGGKFVLSRSEQSHYALGLLSVEYDLQRLELREEG